MTHEPKNQTLADHPYSEESIDKYNDDKAPTWAYVLPVLAVICALAMLIIGLT